MDSPQRGDNTHDNVIVIVYDENGQDMSWYSSDCRVVLRKIKNSALSFIVCLNDNAFRESMTINVPEHMVQTLIDNKTPENMRIRSLNLRVKYNGLNVLDHVLSFDYVKREVTQ